MKKEEFLRTIKYLAFSASGTVIGFLTQALFNDVLGWQKVSYAFSMVIVVLWTFTFNRKFTFRAANNVPIAVLKVAGYYVCYIPLSNWWFNILTDAGLPWIASRLILSAINFVFCFYYDRFVVFGQSIDTNNIAKKEQEKQQENESKKCQCEDNKQSE